MNIIKIDPFTRVNDNWIRTEQINASPVLADVQHPLITSGPSGGGTTHFYADFYSKIALDIVTETAFHYPYARICEKTLRPINCKRMFIIVGPAGSLKLLHSKGFETFGDIIDESYDDIYNAQERFLSVVNAIEQFCKLDLDQIKSYYNTNRQKFDHNWHTLKNLLQSEIQEFTQEK